MHTIFGQSPLSQGLKIEISCTRTMHFSMVSLEEEGIPSLLIFEGFKIFHHQSWVKLVMECQHQALLIWVQRFSVLAYKDQRANSILRYLDHCV